MGQFAVEVADKFGHGMRGVEAFEVVLVFYLFESRRREVTGHFCFEESGKDGIDAQPMRADFGRE